MFSLNMPFSLTLQLLLSTLGQYQASGWYGFWQYGNGCYPGLFINLQMCYPVKYDFSYNSMLRHWGEYSGSLVNPSVCLDRQCHQRVHSCIGNFIYICWLIGTFMRFWDFPCDKLKTRLFVIIVSCFFIKNG